MNDLRLFYGWYQGKFVLLVQDKNKTKIIARISLNTVEARLISNSIDLEKGQEITREYYPHEQIV